MIVPFRYTPEFEELSEAILRRVSRGFDSCAAVVLVLNSQALRSYREHSLARKDSSGFEDYDHSHWNNLSSEEKISIRVSRLKKWMDEFNPSPLHRDWTRSQFLMNPLRNH